jgi:nanoRNase/pAp phosphatase (c-di-AMP/oligoRNAs hydrolase)
MDFAKKARELISSIRKYTRILVTVQGSPDPDAVASAFAFKLICEERGITATVLSPQVPSLAQNNMLIKDLNLPIGFRSPQPKEIRRYDAYAVLDFQTIAVEGVTGSIPCVAHIDHHEAEEDLPVDFRLIMENIGSTSSIMVLLLDQMDMDLSASLWRRAATALYYGIKTDTDGFSHASELDQKAVRIIEPAVDHSCVNRISNMPVSREETEIFRKAHKQPVIFRDWLIAGVGFTREEHRDNLGLAADLLLKREGITTVVIFSIIEGDRGLNLDASFRTRDPNLDLNRLIKGLAADGGARHFKGAFQVNLDFFLHAPHRDQLWNIVRDTTINALKSRIKGITPGGLGHFLKRFIRKINGFFKKD